MDVLTEHANARAKPALPRWLLLAGLLTGAGVAATGLITAGPGLPSQAVARVNDRLIPRDAWLRAVAAVASERRGELTDADQRHILDRLIDEELLVQHGVALGLVEQDARLRSTMVSEVMQAATGAAANPVPDDDALRAFYATNAAFFAPTARVRLQAWRLDSAGQRQPFSPPVPDAMLPLAKLQTYLGPALTAQAAALEPGAPSTPIAAEGGTVVLQLMEKEAQAELPFEQVREEVRAEYKRRADETAVRDLLTELRRSSRVTVAPDLK